MTALTPQSAPRDLVDRATRTITTLIVARLVTPGGEGLCRIRNISAGGFLIESATPLAPEVIVRVELRGGERLDGRVAWSLDGRAGVAAAEPIDVAAIVGTGAPAGSRLRRTHQPRGPRIAVDREVGIALGERRSVARLLDISQGGARLALRNYVRVGERLTLELPGLPIKSGYVRWSGHEIGVAFAEPLGFQALSRWLAEEAPALSR